MMAKKRIVISERDNIAALFAGDQALEFIIHRGDVLLGDIYLASVENILPSIDAAFVYLGGDKMGFLHSSDVQGKGDLKLRLKPKQRMLVQVMKEPTGHKGPRVTTEISLPGRFLVMMPESKGVSISRKIEQQSERSRLKSIVSLIKPPGMGVIIRTEAQGVSNQDIQEDFEVLLDRWQNIVAVSEQTNPPALLYRDQDLLYRVIREMVTDDVQDIVVDTPFGYQRAQQLLSQWGLDKSIRMSQHTSNQSILQTYGVDREIKQALQTKVPMPSGGYLYIQQTEALNVIDVNSGKLTNLQSQAETIRITNLEATKEIARQLRLRNIGGMIVVDFIDMESRADQLMILEAFENELATDKAKPQIGQLSDLGLVEMTRHRQGQSLHEIFTKVCPTCHGTGHAIEDFSWASPALDPDRSTANDRPNLRNRLPNRPNPRYHNQTQTTPDGQTVPHQPITPGHSKPTAIIQRQGTGADPRDREPRERDSREREFRSEGREGRYGQPREPRENRGGGHPSQGGQGMPGTSRRSNHQEASGQQAREKHASGPRSIIRELTGLPLFEHFLKPNHRKGSHIQGTVFPFKAGDVFKAHEGPKPTSGAPSESSLGSHSIEDAIMALALYPFKFALTAKTIMRPLEANNILSRLNPRAQDVFCLVYLLQEQGNNPLLSLDDNDDPSDEDSEDLSPETDHEDTPMLLEEPASRGGRSSERPYREPRQRQAFAETQEDAFTEAVAPSKSHRSEKLEDMTHGTLASSHEEDLTDTSVSQALEGDDTELELEFGLENELEGRHGAAQRRNRQHRSKPSPQKRKAAHHEKPHKEDATEEQPAETHELSVMPLQEVTSGANPVLSEEAPMVQPVELPVTLHLPEPPEKLFEAMHHTEGSPSVEASPSPMSFTVAEVKAPSKEVPMTMPSPEEHRPVVQDELPTKEEATPASSEIQLPQLPQLPPVDPS
ncbi:MAG: Rne/Rng family ribonuclease [Vampirovibrionales bacterium]